MARHQRRRTASGQRALAVLLACCAAACYPADERVALRSDLDRLRLLVGIDGLSPPVDIAVPAGTGSMLIEVHGARGRYYLAELLTPSGRDLVSSATYVSRESEDTYAGQVNWLIPNTPDQPSLRLQEGHYQLTLRGETVWGGPLREEVEIIIYFKREPAPGVGCGVSLDFLIADDALLAADVAPVTQALVDRVARLYRQADIRISDHSWSLVRLPSGSASAADRPQAVIREVDDWLAYARERKLVRPHAVHVLLVNWLGYLDPEQRETRMLGFSMGLPGPYDGGLDNAAILLATRAAASRSGRFDLDKVAGTMAHELGHYLGLLHTSEKDSDVHDPLDDTPPCVAGCKNIMAPVSGSSRRVEFTPDQAWVMQRHPICVEDGT
jgi:hypothetical protein